MKELTNSSPVQDEAFIFRGRRFVKTTWNGLAVIKDELTGYYQASKACKDNGKRINDWLSNKETQEYLNVVSCEYKCPIEYKCTDARIRAPAEHEELTQFLMHQYIIDGNDLKVYGFLQGYYLNPNIFHSACEWIDDTYAVKVAYLLNLINERNRLLNLVWK